MKPESRPNGVVHNPPEDLIRLKDNTRFQNNKTQLTQPERDLIHR